MVHPFEHAVEDGSRHRRFLADDGVELVRSDRGAAVETGDAAHERTIHSRASTPPIVVEDLAVAPCAQRVHGEVASRVLRLECRKAPGTREDPERAATRVRESAFGRRRRELRDRGLAAAVAHEIEKAPRHAHRRRIAVERPGSAQDEAFASPRRRDVQEAHPLGDLAIPFEPVDEIEARGGNAEQDELRPRRAHVAVLRQRSGP